MPAGISDEAVLELVESVPFDPQQIAERLNRVLLIEKAWMQFFKNNNITYESLAYEDFVANYEYYIDYFLDKFQVPVEERYIPEKPMKKVANYKNEELRTRFINLITNSGDSVDG